MKEVGIELSKELRDPQGPHRVDIIIALTHCRIPNVGSKSVYASDLLRIFDSATSSAPCRTDLVWRMSTAWIFLLVVMIT